MIGLRSFLLQYQTSDRHHCSEHHHEACPHLPRTTKSNNLYNCELKSGSISPPPRCELQQENQKRPAVAEVLNLRAFRNRCLGSIDTFRVNLPVGQNCAVWWVVEGRGKGKLEVRKETEGLNAQIDGRDRENKGRGNELRASMMGSQVQYAMMWNPDDLRMEDWRSHTQVVGGRNRNASFVRVLPALLFFSQRPSRAMRASVCRSEDSRQRRKGARVVCELVVS